MRQDHPYFDGPYPRAFAHRGWHIGELAGLENSLSGFRRAAAEGYRYLETDVRATRDGTVVVQHDATLGRTTDTHGAVAELPTLVVCAAKIGGVEPVCRLSDLLEELPDALFNIDVKSDDAVEPVLNVLRHAAAFDRVCLAAFSDRRLARLRRLAGPRLLTSMGPRSAAALLAQSHLPWLPVGGLIGGELAQVPTARGRLTLVDRRFVTAAHRRGAEVHVWTVNDGTQMRELLDIGVDGIVTDAPDVLRAVLADHAAGTR